MAVIVLRIEWRKTSEESGFLIGVDETTNEVVEAWISSPGLLTEFLNDMDLAKLRTGQSADVADRDPAWWGDLVLSRDMAGDVLFIDPQHYWESLFTIFRVRGADPHYWRGPAQD